MSNAPNLQASLEYLQKVVDSRLQIRFGLAEQVEIEVPRFISDGSPFSQFMEEYKPGFEEYIVLMTALAPHISPGFFTRIVARYLPDGGDIPEMGGVRTQQHRDLIPTGTTVQFLLAEEDLGKRLEIQQLFDTGHWFYQKSILSLESVPAGEPRMSGRIMLDAEILEKLCSGNVTRPPYSIEFPAEYIETGMEWDDLVLTPETHKQIRDIESWIRHEATFFGQWNMKKKIKPGYRALFHGPPGTGKTLTAALLGKNTGKDVYRIDLSMVVSKYIGETEKNLARLFDKAENKNWILFFDEADALFGKRTGIRDAHDKYANQEVSYLLQRIESYPGLIILATNFKSNIDEAFLRRFQSVIYFPVPRPEERKTLWTKAFPKQVKLEDRIDTEEIARRYELSGAGIMNVVQFCCIAALEAGTKTITAENLKNGIRNELMKEGKVL